MFKSKRRPLLGVDISSTAVRILELSKTGHHYTVAAYASTALPDNAILDHHIKNKDAVVACIKTTLNMAPFSSKQAAVAIPDALAISKIIQIKLQMD